MGLALSKRTTMQPLHKIYIGLGTTYTQMKRYDSARIYLNIGLQRAMELNYKDDLAYIYSSLADVYTAEHKFELANKYRKAYSDMRDSLINDEKIRSTNTLEVKYRTADKDRKIAETQLQILTRDNKLKQKNDLIIFVLCIIAVLAIIVVSVYRSMRRKERFEKQELLNLQQKQQIGQLKSVMAGEEKERTRIARELHDGIMIQLAVIKMKIRKARVLQQPESEDNLNEILQQLDNTSRELRQTAHNLMPDMLLETGLTDALFYYCNNLQKEVSFNIIFQHYGSLPRISAEAELYLYRIVQELLQNIIKHAHASKALVQMNYHPPLLSFSVEDNGIGFDKHVIDAGMGLKSIDSRLRVLNGTIDIKSNKYQGTTIFIELNIETFIQPKTNNNANTGSNSR
jgi:signal transduction histidine kinase